ncbi:uncharacterized protein LOC143291023 [Babylonia areolata]|uniref:uncharacterized protein LOC143291023 n=1 Tax=Babylonia areolata TaxID=304850 RepID=UPI003FCF9A52
MYQPVPGKPYQEPRITVRGQNLQAVDNFTYLGSTLSRAVNTDAKSQSQPQRSGEGDSPTETEAELTKRLRNYEQLCTTGAVEGQVHEVYYHLASNLSVCHVPKAGCTFWKRIFHFLYNETGDKTVSSPFDIERYDVHFLTREKVKVIEYGQNWKERGLVDGTTKALFTRDPYSRLWAVYVDKFLLPDSWLDHGMAIVQRRKNRTESQRPCADNIAFPEFLKYAVMANYEPHVLPVHKVCNPCRFHPHYVGKMETFTRDAAYILKRAGLGSVLDGYDHARHVQEEVRMLTMYHFRLYETRPGLRECVTHSGIAVRLWKAFVFNGYIWEQLPIPEKELAAQLDGVYTREAARRARRVLLEAHAASAALVPRTSRALRDHQRRVLAAQFRALPADLLQTFVSVYRGDFDLFGYQATPGDVFGGL